MPRPFRLNPLAALVVLAVAPFCPGAAMAGPVVVDTVLLIRHGEKPPEGLGQLDCRGLNRALALPRLISARFGRPDRIIVPSPASRKNDGGKPYSYVRPLATVEPTAIAFGLPVDATIGFADHAALRERLDTAAPADRLTLVAWEHNILPRLARDLLARHGAAATAVPEWARDDYDMIFVVTIRRDGAASTASFSQGSQGLNGLAATCPGLSAPDAQSSTALEKPASPW